MQPTADSDANKESLYSLSIVAAATIAAINNTVNNNSNTSLAQTPHNSSSNNNSNTSNFDEASNENANNNSNISMMNLELIKNMLLSQMESQKKKKCSDSNGNTSNQNAQEYDSTPEFSFSNFKYKLSSITPPTSTSSVSSTSSSPNGQKNANLYASQGVSQSSSSDSHPTPQNHSLQQHLINLPEHSLSANFFPAHLPGFYSNQMDQAYAQAEQHSLYQSNFESLMKMQTLSTLNGGGGERSPLFNSLLHNEFMANNSMPVYYNVPNSNYLPTTHKDTFNCVQMRQHQQPHHLLQSKMKLDCSSDQNSPCKHAYELEKLRTNVFKLLFNLMPNLIAAFNLDMDTVHNTAHIDTLIEYVINHNQNISSKTNQL